MLFGPIIRFLNEAANATVRRLGIEPTEELATVRSLPRAGAAHPQLGRGGPLEEESATLFSRSVRFVEKDAADVLVPRTEVVGVSPADTLVELVARSSDTGYSRFPFSGRPRTTCWAWST